MIDALYDVVAVDLESNVVRILETSKTESNAEAIVRMAVMRRGVDKEFFSEVPAGLYENGDTWHGME